MLSEVEQGVLAKAIQPYAAAGVPVAYAHRDQPNVGAAAVARMQRCGHDLADDTDGDRAKRILPAVFAGENDFGATADRAGARRIKPRSAAPAGSVLPDMANANEAAVKTDLKNATRIAAPK